MRLLITRTYLSGHHGVALPSASMVSGSFVSLATTAANHTSSGSCLRSQELTNAETLSSSR